MMIGAKRNPFAQDVGPMDLGPQINVPAPTAAPAGNKINWLGVLADALSGAAGQAPMFAQNLQRQKQQQGEEALWDKRYALKRRDDLADAQWQVDHRRDPTVDAVTSYMAMTPEQKEAYKAMHPGLDPDVATTLPNGQFYAGPRSGLAAALSGGAQPAPATSLPPKSRLIPMGGPTPPASGTFRR